MGTDRSAPVTPPSFVRSERVASARSFAISAHGMQRYGDGPYVTHLDEVAALLQPHGEDALVVAYLHDLCEDTDVPLGAVWLRFGAHIARQVMIVSDELLAPRGERKRWVNAKLAAAGLEDQVALCVKVADRLANVQACQRDGDTVRLVRYRREQGPFRDAAYRAGLVEPLWRQLELLTA